MENKKGISVVIPNYNGSGLLPQILPPLFTALEFTALPYEVIVSDDRSSDDSVTLLRNNFPAIKILEADTNRGFSPTANKGIFAAQYELVLLLNSDVKLTENYFEKLLPYFNDRDTFGVMGRIIGWDDDLVQDGGKYPSFHGVKIKTSGNYIPEDAAQKKPLYSMYLSGANMLASREKLAELAGFDEIFAPFYIEDVDLSLRAWRLGWTCYYEHNAVCRHKISATIRKKSRKNFVKKIYYRNKMFLHAIHLDNRRMKIRYLQLIPEMFLHLFTGRLWFFASLKMFFASRQKIQLSKQRFQMLAEKENSHRDIGAVTEKILSSLQKTAIKRF